MPTWGELPAEVQAQVIIDHIEGADWDVLFNEYGVTNSITARRKADERIRTIRRTLGKGDAATGYPNDNAGVSEVFEAWAAYQNAVNRIRDGRIVTSVDLRVDDDRPIALALPADWHVGDIGTDHEALRAHAELLGETEGMYSIVGGDTVTNMIHPRIVEAHNADAPSDVQYMMLEWLLEQLRPLAIRHGNHSSWTAQFAGVDMLAEIAKRQNVICTAEGVEIRLHVGQQVYTLFIQHRYRYGSSFNLTHTVKRLWEMGICDFDIGVVEHQHVPAVEPFVKHGRERLAIRPGTYKTRDAWAQKYGFYGARIGVPIVFLWPDRHRMEMRAPIGEVEGACEYLAWLRR